MILPSSFPTWLNAHPNRWLNTIASAFAFPFDRAIPVNTIFFSIMCFSFLFLRRFLGRKRGAGFVLRRALLSAGSLVQLDTPIGYFVMRSYPPFSRGPLRVPETRRWFC